MNKEKHNHPTIMRGLIVLEKVVQAQRPISATELIEVLDVPREQGFELSLSAEDLAKMRE